MRYRCNEKVPYSGIYNLYDKDGKKVGERTCVKGEPFPPSPKKNMYYQIKQQTKSKN